MRDCRDSVLTSLIQFLRGRFLALARERGLWELYRKKNKITLNFPVRPNSYEQKSMKEHAKMGTCMEEISGA